MVIKLSNVVPAPLKERQPLNSEIWGIEMTLSSSELTHISAPSGTGKTTFIHTIYGIRRDYTGDVAIDNRAIAGATIQWWSKLRQKHLAIVFQDLRLFHDLTAWDNLLVKNNLTHHFSEAEIAAMASRLGIAQLLPKNAGTLSQGEKQRVAILRALLQPFDLILLDEPFSHLDADNAKAAALLIKEECEARGAGLVIAQHGSDAHFEYTKRLAL